MGSQIIRQPDGKYCMFSSICDDFTVVDATGEEIVDILAKWAAEEARKRSKMSSLQILAALDAGDKPYHQFTMTYWEAVERRKAVHRK
jgi:uncharacterized protein YcgI (DUF1989 family)